jgi:protein-tyrosine phosphatase
LLAIAADRGHPVRQFSYPIPDFGVTNHAGYDAIMYRIRAEIDAGRIVYVHCWGGRGRTSTVIGCWLADAGLSYADTIARIAELRSGTRKSHGPCPESTVQHELLKSRCGH